MSVFLIASIPPKPGLADAFRLGETSLARCVDARPLGVQVCSVSVSVAGVELRANLEGVVVAAAILVGEGLGVDCLNGDGDAGLSGRRNGDALGEPYESGEGLYEVVITL